MISQLAGYSSVIPLLNPVSRLQTLVYGLLAG